MDFKKGDLVTLAKHFQCQHIGVIAARAQHRGGGIYDWRVLWLTKPGTFTYRHYELQLFKGF